MECMDLQVDIDDLEIDNDNIEVIRAPKRYIRDAANPFDFYNNLEFQKRFRFSKESVLHGILPKIEEEFNKTK